MRSTAEHREDSGASWTGSQHPPAILFFGTFNEELHPRVRVLREGLTAQGANVTVVNRPLAAGTAERVEMLRRPIRLLGFLFAVASAWLRLAVEVRRRRLKPDVVVVGYLGHLDVHLARLLFPRATIVLDHLVGLSDTAHDRRVEGRIDPMLQRIDDWAQRRADVVLFDTDEQREQLGHAARDAVVVPVGAPSAFFTSRGRVDRAPPLRVLFFGLFTPLQGAETIGAAIAELRDHAGIHFTIVGHGQDHEIAQRVAATNPNIDWIDWVPSEQLPDLVATHDVCLGIFGTTTKALRVVPNKVYQGLAAGAAVVTSDTESQRALLGEAAFYVAPGDPDELAKALQLLVERPEQLVELQRRARGLADERFTPGAVVCPLVRRLGG